MKIIDSNNTVIDIDVIDHNDEKEILFTRYFFSFQGKSFTVTNRIDMSVFWSGEDFGFDQWKIRINPRDPINNRFVSKKITREERNLIIDAVIFDFYYNIGRFIVDINDFFIDNDVNINYKVLNNFRICNIRKEISSSEDDEIKIVENSNNI